MKSTTLLSMVPRGWAAFLAVGLTLIAFSAPALTLTGVQSRKPHPSSGASFDLTIETGQAPAGSLSIESRAMGAAHTLVFQFDGTVTSAGNLSVIDDALALLPGGSAIASGSEVIVTLPAITDNRRITVTLENINGSGLNASASLGFLVGDVNDSRSINAADISAVKARSAQSATGATARFDVNASGTVSAADIAAIKARSGLALAVPPGLVGATIGAGGGVINGPDGVQVVVPADAIASPVTFRVERDDAGAPLLKGLNAASPVYAVTPHGQLFDGSAVFSIPLSAAQIPAGATPLLLKAELGGAWRVLRNISTDPTRLAADITGLSYFVIGTCSSVPTDLWTIGGVNCPANHELRLTMLDQQGTIVQVLRGPNGVQLPLWYVTDVPQTRTFMVWWTRPAGTVRTDRISVLGARGGFNPNPVDVTTSVNIPFTVTIDPAQIPGANSANGRLLRVTAIADYTTTAFRIGTGNVPVGFSFETDIPILVRYNGVLPTITAQPADIGVIVGQPAGFTVVASGANLTYQWSSRANASAAFATISGANSPTYTLAAAQLADHGTQFQVLVCSSPTACVPSNPATLTVLASASAPVFTLHPIDRSVVAGQTVSFSVIAGGQPIPQVKWQSAAAATTTFTDLPVQASCGPGTQSVYSSSVSASCTVTVALGDNGKRYRAVAINVAAPGGVPSTFATVTVTATPVAPQITQQPVAQATAVGGSATYSVAATGTATLNYTWRFAGNPANLPSVSGGFAFAAPGGTCSGMVTYSNGNTTITLSNLTAACDGLALIVTVSNGINPGATSNPAALTVNAIPTATSGACLAGTIGWCYATPLPQANPLSGLVYRSGTFTAVGRGGTTLRTSDTGNTWQTSFEPGRANWSDVANPAPGLLVAAGWFNVFSTQNSGIFTSTDDGVTWTRRLDAGFPGTIAVTKLAFADALVGVAAGNLGIWRTEDGGQTWTSVSNAPSTAGVVTDFYGGVAWADATTVLIYGGQGMILRSTDAGLNWTDVSNPAITSTYYDMVFNSAGVGIAVGPNGQVARSSGGGDNWQEVITPMSDAGTAVAFADDNTVVVMGNLSQTMRSTDAGQTWNVGFIGGGSNVYRLKFATPTTGLAVGAGGQIARTVDGGESWSIIGGGIYDQRITGLSVSPSGSVVLAGALANAGFLLRSITSGATWASTGTRYTAPSFASDQVAIAINPDGRIVRSTDAGQTWTVVYENLLGPQTLLNTTMITASVGLVVGDNGRILRTTDGGLNWSVTPSGITSVIRVVRCLTTTLCLAGGGYSGLLRSTDAGVSWSLVTPAGMAGVNSIARVSDTIAVVADGAGWQRTTDGGQTWTRVYTAVLGSQLGASFNAAGVGIAVGYDGILRSTDSGLSWVRQNLPISFDLYSATWLNATTVLVGGEGGAILRNLQAGVP